MIKWFKIVEYGKVKYIEMCEKMQSHSIVSMFHRCGERARDHKREGKRNGLRQIDVVVVIIIIGDVNMDCPRNCVFLVPAQVLSIVRIAGSFLCMVVLKTH